MVLASASLMVSCFDSPKPVVEDNSERDSLEAIIDQKNDELNEMMSTFNEIQDGFNKINEAEGRINLLSDNAESNSAAENIKENMEFIATTLEENRKKIADLEEKLKNSTINTAKMQETLDGLTKQLQQKQKDIDELKRQLAEKDVQIAQLGQSVTTLKEENVKVKAESEANAQEAQQQAQIAQAQDAQLNTAWYMFGTTKELKAHKILESGDVLQNEDFDRDYFTKIDIRKVSVIPLNAKHAKLLTNHPADSYSLLKDSKGEYTLRITDASRFWSVSKYLVIKVR